MKRRKTGLDRDKKPTPKVSLKDVNLESAVRDFFQQIGEDPDRDGIKETPRRFEQAIKYLLGGYDRSFEGENKLFENLSNYQDIIILKNIDFFSMCEHHLLPFFGHAHIGYIPGEKDISVFQNHNRGKRGGTIVSQSQALDLISKMGVPERILNKPFFRLDNQDVGELATAVRGFYSR